MILAFQTPAQDAPIVQILCEWAVSALRWGEHRSMAVAWLLDKRQSEVTSTDNDNYQNNDKDDKDSISSGNGMLGGVPVFQNILMNFLDNDAPTLGELRYKTLFLFFLLQISTSGACREAFENGCERELMIFSLYLSTFCVRE